METDGLDSSGAGAELKVPRNQKLHAGSIPASGTIFQSLADSFSLATGERENNRSKLDNHNSN
jgi:hypothetical protein